MNPLRIAYAANILILILIPVVSSLLLTRSPLWVFGPAVSDSPALRVLVLSLWGAILLCSILGLRWPAPFAGILVLQIIYKLAWLFLYAVPTLLRAPATFTSWGPAITFLPIVLLWPFLLRNAIKQGSLSLQ